MESKAEFKKGEVGQEPQVLFDAKTGKISPLTWVSAGKKVTFLVEPYKYGDGTKKLTVEVYTESLGDKKEWVQTCTMDPERDDRIEMMSRDDSDAKVVQTLHTLCIHPGESGHTKGNRRYVDPKGDLGIRGEYTEKGVFYEPVVEHPDGLLLHSLAVDDDHACGIRLNGDVVCWGSLISIGEMPELHEFEQVSVGLLQSCGIKKDKTMQCWGEVGLDWEDLDSAKPFVAPGGTYAQVAVGGAFICSIDTAGKTRCVATEMWKKKKKKKQPASKVGNIIAAAAGKEQIEPPAGDFTVVRADRSIACGLLRDKTIRCWGNTADAFGLLSGVPSGTFSQIALDDTSACGLRTDGSLVCWGSIREGGEPPEGEFGQVSVGSSYACAITSDGTMRCWGGYAKEWKAPTGKFRYVGAGERYACAIRVDNTTVCWGEELHDGRTRDQVLHPLY